MRDEPKGHLGGRLHYCGWGLIPLESIISQLVFGVHIGFAWAGCESSEHDLLRRLENSFDCFGWNVVPSVELMRYWMTSGVSSSSFFGTSPRGIEAVAAVSSRQGMVIAFIGAGRAFLIRKEQ